MRATKNQLSLLRVGRVTRLLSLLLLLMALPVVVQSEDFAYTTNNGAITITKYTGAGGAVVIPDTINDLPVISIGGKPPFVDPSGMRVLVHGFWVSALACAGRGEARPESRTGALGMVMN